MSARRGLALLARLFGLDGRAVQMLGDGAAVDGQERLIVLRVRLEGKRLTGGHRGDELVAGRLLEPLDHRFLVHRLPPGAGRPLHRSRMARMASSLAGMM